MQRCECIRWWGESQCYTHITSTSHWAWTHFTHPLIQTWPLWWAHTIFGQWSLEVIHWCEFECDGGSGQSLLRRSRCCLLRAGRHAKPAGRAGRAEVPIAPACPRWRWRGGEKFHRSADGQENLTAHCWHQQDHRNQPYHGLTVCEAVPRVLTVWDSSQQAWEPTGETAGTLCGSHFVSCADTNCSTSTSAASDLTQFDLLLKRQTQRHIKLYSFVYHFHTTCCYSVEMARLGKTVDSLKNCNTKTPKNKLLWVLSKFTLVEWKETTELNHKSDAALGQCKASSSLTW